MAKLKLPRILTEGVYTRHIISNFRERLAVFDFYELIVRLCCVVLVLLIFIDFFDASDKIFAFAKVTMITLIYALFICITVSFALCTILFLLTERWWLKEHIGDFLFVVTLSAVFIAVLVVLLPAYLPVTSSILCPVAPATTRFLFGWF